MKFKATNALARHHRQVLGGDAASGHQGRAPGAVLSRAWSARSKTYQTDYLLDPQTVAPGGTASTTTRLFAGAKEVADGRRLRQAARASTASTC